MVWEECQAEVRSAHGLESPVTAVTGQASTLASLAARVTRCGQAPNFLSSWWVEIVCGLWAVSYHLNVVIDR